VNGLTGFFSASLVLAAYAFGYWQMVAGARESVPHHELPDIVDRIDDRYGLWEEERDHASAADIKTVLAEEKARLKKSRRGIKEFFRSAKPAISLYRLAAYGVLVGGVYILIRAERFDALCYLIGAGAAPMVTAVVLYAGKRETVKKEKG
jgi:hypothetical protein